MNRETRCEVLCSETLICRIWLELCSKLEGNKDHLLSQARSDLASRDLHVESLNKCIKRKSKDWNYRTHNTNLLNLVENKLDCKRSYYEKDKSSSRYAVRSKHEMGKMKRAQEQQVDEFSMQKVRENHETINSSLPNCKKCKNRRILWTILENSRMLNQIIVEGCLTFPVNLRWLRSSRSLLSRDKRLPLDTWNQSGVQEKRFWKSIFYVWLTSRFSSKNFIWRRAKKSKSSNWRSKGKNKSDKWRRTKLWHNPNADVCDKTVASWYSAELHGRTAKTANVGTTIRQVPCFIIILGVENKIQNTVSSALILRRKLCYGSKKRRWLILWMS